MLSRAPFAKSYVGKIFFTAFLGTHVPLLALVFYWCASPSAGEHAGGSGGDDVRDLVSRADEALYKAEGGNTVVYLD